ncbi:hypothetical protein HanIR_Chr15g0733051 [Helianthus annuus]|nr:hypothetical protein HanIR_Chr15g0733051 [Helianthus annuus]
MVPEGANKSYKYIKCNFCNKLITSGVSRMKAHLGGTHKNVAPCCQVPQEVRDEIKEYVKQIKTTKFQYQRVFEERIDAGAYFVSSTGGSGTGSGSVESSACVQKGPMQQSMLRFLNPEVDNEEGSKGEVKMTPVVAKEQRNRVCLNIKSQSFSDFNTFYRNKRNYFVRCHVLRIRAVAAAAASSVARAPSTRRIAAQRPTD